MSAKRRRRGRGFRRDSTSAEVDRSSNPGNRRIAHPPSSAVVNATGAALKSCGLRPRAFAVAILHDDGRVTFETSSNTDRFNHLLFPKGGWERLQQTGEQNDVPPSVDDDDSHEDDETASPALSVGALFFSDDDDARRASSPPKNRYYLPPRVSRARKDRSPSPLDSPPGRRLRSSSGSRRKTAIDDSQSEDTQPTQAPSQPKPVPFYISNEKAVQDAYEKRLRQIQQMGLKKILKAWIKVAEPKKQPNYPYISSREGQNREPKVPPWWPIDRVIHKEPDHINKESRIILAVVMLRMRDRSPGWVAKLEESTKNLDLGNDERSKAVERVARRRKLLQSLYDIAKQEEEYYLGDIDGTTMYTMYDIPPIKDVPKKRVPSKSSGNKQSSKKAKHVPPPSSVQSTHQLVSPTARLGLENVAQPAPRYHHRLAEPPNSSVSASEAPHYNRHDGMLSGIPLAMTMQDTGLRHGYPDQQHNVIPPRFADSQMEIDGSFSYDAKNNQGLYGDPSRTYISLRDRNTYKPRVSPAVYNNWHPAPAAEPFSPSPTSYTTTPTHSYQPTVASYAERMDYSYPAPGHANQLAFQTPTPVTSPVELAPSTSQSFGQSSAHDLQERGPQSSLGASQYPGSNFRPASYNHYLMPDH